MGKKEKIIITILLAIILLLIIAYLMYQNVYLSSLPSETGIIVKKDDKEIILKDSKDTTKISYIISTEKDTPIIKDVSGKKINYSNLNVGDEIRINYKNEQDVDLLSQNTINNIKLIQVIEDNSDNHMTKDDLSYNYYSATLYNYVEKILNFCVSETNSNYPIDDFFSTDVKIKITKKDNDSTEQIIKQYESSEITCKKYLESEYIIVLNNVLYSELQDELEIGKYILRIENENEGVIKIPFEKNEENFLQWN